MREIRKYGSAGGVAGNGHPYPDNRSPALVSCGQRDWESNEDVEAPFERGTRLRGAPQLPAERLNLCVTQAVHPHGSTDTP